jgi:hypothetical protein
MVLPEIKSAALLTFGVNAFLLGCYVVWDARTHTSSEQPDSTTITIPFHGRGVGIWMAGVGLITLTAAIRVMMSVTG